jgi:D-alanyl-D-alanine carboxypeptidase/D-alanyl-D-alanine-endopeptidase (penicillin-binding protein 4)
MRWRTELRSAAPIGDGVLLGDLVLRGGADGDLTWEAFYGLLQTLRQRGIKKIRGDLILDRQHFQPARTDIGLPPFDESPEFQYNVIPDALLINTNLLRFDFESDDQALRVRMTPELDGASMDLQLKLIDRECAKWEDGWQVPGYTKAADGSIRIQLRGTFPRNCSTSTRINVLERNDFVDRLFRYLWAYLGGTFHGVTREGTAPADTRLLAEHRSRTLADTLREINKPSDNPLSRLMFLTLGTLDSGNGTTLEKADRQVRSWFGKLGIADDGLVLDNGSGLSRKERIRPSQLASLLVAAYHSNWAPEFLSSLPIVALDGTMRRRMHDSPVAGRARMKTGTLRNVVALAGYVPDASGQMHVVVAMINHDLAKSAVAQPILDALVDWLARPGGIAGGNAGGK